MDATHSDTLSDFLKIMILGHNNHVITQKHFQLFFMFTLIMVRVLTPITSVLALCREQVLQYWNFYVCSIPRGKSDITLRAKMFVCSKT